MSSSILAAAAPTAAWLPIADILHFFLSVSLIERIDHYRHISSIKIRKYTSFLYFIKILILLLLSSVWSLSTSSTYRLPASFFRIKYDHPSLKMQCSVVYTVFYIPHAYVFFPVLSLSLCRRFLLCHPFVRMSWTIGWKKKYANVQAQAAAIHSFCYAVELPLPPIFFTYFPTFLRLLSVK